jgi:indolepyruvate ferredoxin oxidoreductase
VSVAFNKAAFNWGRTAAHDLGSVTKLTTPAKVIEFKRIQTLDDLIAKRGPADRLPGREYAKQYKSFVEQVRAEEAKLGKEPA